jgi:formylmethanofuran dehydrogenase subunit E
MKRLDIQRAADEEIVAICENDSCAVDGCQKMLGTTAGKGNLIIRDYGKNVYTVYSRKAGKGCRFSRIFEYEYTGAYPEEFAVLENAVASKTATPEQTARQKFLKSMDLAEKPFEKIFRTTDVPFQEIPYAPLAPSVACASCGELTMKTKMIETVNGERLCHPCSSGR